MSPQELLLRLATAAFLGSLVGLERHRSDKAAGIRTHMLVSLGSALFMVISVHGFDREIRTMQLNLDPSRIAAQVVSGIGFLGAGTILRRNETVLGLTTAASVWAVAAVGLAAGCGLYLAAVLATLLMLIVLAVLKPIEESIVRSGGRQTVTLFIDQGAASPLPQIESVVLEAQIPLKGIHLDHGDQTGATRLTLTLGRNDQAKLMSLLNQLQTLPGVRGLEYETGPST